MDIFWLLVYAGRAFAVLPVTWDEDVGRFRHCPIAISYSCAYCAACLVLGAYHALLNVTLTTSPTELVGSLARGLVEVAAPMAVVVAAAINAGRFPSLRASMEDIDRRLGATAGDERSARRYSARYLCYALSIVAYATFGMLQLGLMSCEAPAHDRLGLGERVMPCGAGAAANAAFTVLMETPVALVATNLVYLVRSLEAKFKALQDQLGKVLDSNKKDASYIKTTKVLPMDSEGDDKTPATSEDVERLRLLHTDLSSAAASVRAMHSPQLLLICFAHFVASFTDFYFGAMSFKMCLDAGLRIGTPLLLWGVLLVGNMYFVTTTCQDLENTMAETSRILAGGRVDNEAAADELHMFMSVTEDASEDALSASHFFPLNKDFLINFVNTVITYIIIMVQFDVGDQKECFGQEEDAAAAANLTATAVT